MAKYREIFRLRSQGLGQNDIVSSSRIEEKNLWPQPPQATENHLRNQSVPKQRKHDASISIFIIFGKIQFFIV